MVATNGDGKGAMIEESGVSKSSRHGAVPACTVSEFSVYTAATEHHRTWADTHFRARWSHMDVFVGRSAMPRRTSGFPVSRTSSRTSMQALTAVARVQFSLVAVVITSPPAAVRSIAISVFYFCLFVSVRLSKLHNSWSSTDYRVIMLCNSVL